MISDYTINPPSHPTITVTLTSEEYRELRTLICRDTYKDHAGQGLGETLLEGGLFSDDVAYEMGDDRDTIAASEDATRGPL